MVKKLTPLLGLIVLLASCSSLKPTNSINSKPLTASAASSANHNRKEVKFLDEISVQQETSISKVEAPAPRKSSTTSTTTSKPVSDVDAYMNRSSSVEKASAVQIKYAVLLNTEVEQLADMVLLEHVDEWYGTRYRLGGTSKTGIDCSAFVQAVYISAFGLTLPRTARDQYKTSRIISATELKEGDLVFFNTRGGISHVGIYLNNNKFIHASSSQGVTVSDMFDPYYLRRYIGAGRIEKPAALKN